jgi:protein associated with RNAse G/E
MCNSVADFERLRDDNNIPVGKLDGKKLMEMKKIADFIFCDSTRFNIIAYIRKDETEVTYVDELAEYFTSMKAITFVKSYDFSDMDLDTVLEKISTSGMASLTRKEKVFLKNQSKS